MPAAGAPFAVAPWRLCRIGCLCHRSGLRRFDDRLRRRRGQHLAVDLRRRRDEVVGQAQRRAVPDVAHRLAGVTVRARVQVVDLLGLGHHQPHLAGGRAQAIARREPRDLPAQLGVLDPQHLGALGVVTGGRVQLQQRDVQGDEAEQQRAEQQDPSPPAHEALEQRRVLERAPRAQHAQADRAQGRDGKRRRDRAGRGRLRGRAEARAGPDTRRWGRTAWRPGVRRVAERVAAPFRAALVRGRGGAFVAGVIGPRPRFSAPGRRSLPRRPGKLQRRAQAPRLGARVAGHLAGARAHRAAVDQLRLGLAPASADGQVRRADAAPGAVDEEALHHPVLE